MKPDDKHTRSAHGKLSNEKPFLSISIGLIIVLGLLIYYNSLDGQFVWDDYLLVKDNAYVRSFSHIMNVFTKDVGGAKVRQFVFHRPLQMLTYMADYSLWKLDVRGYHITNIILHILVALCILWLVFLLFDDRLLAFLAAAFFVAHPIHTEAVSYISGRADPLAALFMLLAFIFYVKDLTVPMALSCILALLSRENSLILPFLIVLYHYVFKQKLSLKRFLPLACICAAYIAVRLTALRALLTHTASQTTVLERLPGFFVALTTYARLLILPLDLHMEYGNRTFPFSDPRALAGIVIFILLLVFLIRMRASRLASFSLGFFLIALLPSSNLYPLNAYMAEHWLYLPSIGFFLILAKGVRSLYAKKSLEGIAISLVLILVSFYSSLTILQNRYWREPIPFYERAQKYSPESAKVYNNLAFTYQKAGKTKEAEELYKKALDLEPRDADIYYNLGNLYKDTARNEEAIGFYAKAIELNPNDAKVYNNLGFVYTTMGRSKEALASLARAAEMDPEYYTNLGNAYNSMGRREEAITSYKKAIENNPDNAQAYFNLGNTYHALGKDEEAILAYKKALEIKTDYAHAYNGLGGVYSKVGKRDEALLLFKKALEIDPGYSEACYNLGNAYKDLGRNDEAVAAYRKAAELRPDYIDAYNNLGIACVAAGKDAEAIASFKKVIEHDPRHAAAYYNLGTTYYAIGKKEEAVSSYRKAVELKPDYAEAYYNLGNTLKDIGAKEDAVGAYKKAIELKPDYAEAYNNLGGVYFDSGDKEGALALFKKALEVNPRYANAYNNIAIFYFYEKEYARAFEYCDKAKALGFRNPELEKALAPYRKE